MGPTARPVKRWLSTRVGRLALTAAITALVVPALLLFFAVGIPWLFPPDPLDIGSEGQAVLLGPERIEAFELVEDATPNGRTRPPSAWPRGPATALSPALAAEAQRAVLDRTSYDPHPPPDLCADEPSWGLRFIRGPSKVEVLLDRGCWRATILAAQRKEDLTPGVPAGGAKLTAAGHLRFKTLQTALEAAVATKRGPP